MAAYAALVSLQNTITLEKMPRPPSLQNISFDGQLLDSLLERVNFLVEFLEQGWMGAQDLEGLMVDAAYRAEDAIDSYIADQIPGDSTSHRDDGFVPFCRDLEKIIEDIDSIRKMVNDLKQRSEIRDLRLRSATSPARSSNAARHHKKRMVAFEDQKQLLIEKLVGSQRRREVIPIVGMGGMGKTTLARNVYDDENMADNFDIRAWVTVSQEYNMEDILSELLESLGISRNTEMSARTLGEKVHKCLYDRKYLIVIDDIWSVDSWDDLKIWLPDQENKSRVVITTRLSNVANECSSSSLTMEFLNEDSSWTLLSQTVFGQDTCPIPELEDVGKKIAKSCGGLPLAIIAIGGLLAKSDFTLEHWNRVAEDVRSTMHLGTDKQCLEILNSSYKHLPMHLKPCLLYMGLFPEDRKVRVSKLCRLWVAEGFLKLIADQSLEDVAEAYINDLVERNLIFLDYGGKGKDTKFCYIHDLVRDLCLEEAQKGRFFYVAGHNQNGSQDKSTHRRFLVNHQEYPFLESTSMIRSLTSDYDHVVPLHTSRYLRVCNILQMRTKEYGRANLAALSHFVNSRYIDFCAASFQREITHSMSFLRNLQTLVVRVHRGEVKLPPEVWNMLQLRHIKSYNGFYLPAPPQGEGDNEEDYIVLENLQTLQNLMDFPLIWEFVERVPNIRKLKVFYRSGFFNYFARFEGFHFGFPNLVHLEKLESLTCTFMFFTMNPESYLQQIVLPCSLKKLSLHNCGLHWQDMTIIGSLPKLEALRLCGWGHQGEEWNPIEGEFRCLKYLHIRKVYSFKIWTANASHFPRLERLVLEELDNLQEIPSEVGDIGTLCTIEVERCTDSAVVSAMRIAQEQEDVNLDLQVRVYIKAGQREILEGWTGGNFHVKDRPIPSACQLCYDMSGRFRNSSEEMTHEAIRRALFSGELDGMLG